MIGLAVVVLIACGLKDMATRRRVTIPPGSYFPALLKAGKERGGGPGEVPPVLE